ncbi:MAG: hypothetical protein AB7P21_10865 [Lautropia sp.]
MSREDIGTVHRPGARTRSAARRWLWFAGLWLGGVATVSLVAALIRWALKTT